MFLSVHPFFCTPYLLSTMIHCRADKTHNGDRDAPETSLVVGLHPHMALVPLEVNEEKDSVEKGDNDLPPSHGIEDERRDEAPARDKDANVSKKEQWIASSPEHQVLMVSFSDPSVSLVMCHSSSAVSSFFFHRTFLLSYYAKVDKT